MEYFLNKVSDKKNRKKFFKKMSFHPKRPHVILIFVEFFTTKFFFFIPEARFV